MLTTLAQYANETLLLPNQASTFAAEVDWLFYFILWVSVAFFVIIGACMFTFAWKYRQTDRDKVAHGTNHNNALEVTWSVIPLLIVMAIFVWGFRGFLDMTTPPGSAYEVWVDARQWNWEFVYPEGPSSSILHVPANRPVRLVLHSHDVIHSVYIPAFRIKQDVVPGRYNKTWFEAKWDQRKARDVEYQLPGAPEPEHWKNVIVYDLYCAEYCGTRHSMMQSRVVVHTPEGFANWLAQAGQMTGTATEKGATIYARKGCAACHSADGSSGIGPTFRNLFGRKEVLSDGTTITADGNYIRHSIQDPAAQVVQGYQNVMPLLGLEEQEITYVIAWMKSISDHYQGTLEDINAEYGDGAAPAVPDANAQDVAERESEGLPPQSLPAAEEVEALPEGAEPQ